MLFDLDGTVTDSKPGIVASYRHTLDVLGVPIDEPILLRCVGPPLRDSLLSLGVPAGRLEEAIAVYRAWFVSNGIFDNRPYDGTVAMLDRIHRTGVRVGLATSKLIDFATDILTHFGLEAFFDPVCGATRDGRLSHKDEVVGEALLESGIVGSDRVLMVGDREHDMFGAVANGVVPVGVGWGYGTPAELEAAGAKWIVDTPTDLADLIVSLAGT